MAVSESPSLFAQAFCRRMSNPFALRTPFKVRRDAYKLLGLPALRRQTLGVGILAVSLSPRCYFEKWTMLACIASSGRRSLFDACDDFSLDELN